MDEADVCLILEGTYPYVSGGVSTWAHDLIISQPQLTFSLVCILAPDSKRDLKYEIPENVIEIRHIVLQKLPERDRRIPKKWRENLFKDLEIPILHLQYKAKLQYLKQILKSLNHGNFKPDEHVLLNSYEAWKMLLRMYRSSVGEGSYLNFFWSWRGLLAGMYSVLIADLPLAKVYHSLCTGYAGLFLARAHVITGNPCVLTEHGIYTNERRIEITAASWLNDQKAMSLNIMRPLYERDLKDYWIDTFSGYSQLCYQACNKIITLFEGNQKFQLEDGADPEKMMIVPNGIDVERYAAIPKEYDHPPTVAFIGRVVSIKDVKTFIRAVAAAKLLVPQIKALVMGPTDEEEEYFQECVDLVKTMKLQDTLTFTGKLKIEEHLSRIDLIVLTSVSEAQPLVILEAGAAGIPFVATDVGACRELAFGRSDESPPLGQGGEICPLSNAKEVADSIVKLLTNERFYKSCSVALAERIRLYYNKDRQREAYSKIYEEQFMISNKESIAWQG